MGLPKLSIITVVYNSEQFIERTIQSVLGQTYSNIEYIIIDGGSSDKTIDLIKKYNSLSGNWISEKDNGLYDAMNKGLSRVNGDYVCFLNSGDTFFSNDTIEKVFSGISELPDVIYGETIIVDSDGNEIGLRRLKAPDNLSWKSFKKGMLVCHQSIYVKSTEAEKYNLKYKYSADFDWVLKVLKNAKTIHNSNLVLTRFLDGGINKKNIRKGLYERFEIMAHYYGFISTLFLHIPIGIKFIWYYFRNKRF
jgi:glycosyltransferase involved in cell wall biosynthesis